MSSALLVGQPNVGKTCFLVNFCRYLGVKELTLVVKQSKGFKTKQVYSLEEALVKLTSTTPHSTRELQQISIELSTGKQNKQLKLIDSCGLTSGVHAQKKIREAMAQTLERLLESRLVLHMIDLSKFAETNGLSQVDKEIYDFFQSKAGYKILANKIDLDSRRRNLNQLKSAVQKKLVLPISALYKQGFREVQKFLTAYL